MGTLIGSKFLDQKAADFNGTDEYAYVNNPSFKTDTQGTMALWFRPLTVPSASAFKVAWGYGVRDALNNANIQAAVRWDNTGTISAPYSAHPIPDIIARTTHNMAFDRAYGNHIFSAATWAHWCVVCNGSSWAHYVNGTNVGGTYWGTGGGSNSGRWLGHISGSDHRLTFGSGFVSNAAANFGDARQNEAIYVNRSLTSGEITALYNAGTPRNPHRLSLGSALKSWWRFGDSRDDATTIYDEIGSNNLTLVNMDASNYV